MTGNVAMRRMKRAISFTVAGCIGVALAAGFGCPAHAGLLTAAFAFDVAMTSVAFIGAIGCAAAALNWADDHGWGSCKECTTLESEMDRLRQALLESRP